MTKKYKHETCGCFERYNLYSDFKAGCNAIHVA